MKKHPVLLLHSITNGKRINNPSGARATGWEWLCLLQPPFQCNNVALQSLSSALPRSSKADPGTEQRRWMCDSHHPGVWLILGAGDAENSGMWNGLCSCSACGWLFLSERRQGLHGGGEETRGEPSLRRKQRRRDPLPSACSIFCLSGPCQPP